MEGGASFFGAFWNCCSMGLVLGAIARCAPQCNKPHLLAPDPRNSLSPFYYFSLSLQKSAVTGTFIITPPGIFGVTIGNEGNNPKKWRKTTLNKKKMPLHHPFWKKEYHGPRIFAKSYKAWSSPLGFLRRVMRPHSTPRLPQKALLRNLMAAPISGAKTSGFRGKPVPLYQKYRYFTFK